MKKNRPAGKFPTETNLSTDSLYPAFRTRRGKEKEKRGGKMDQAERGYNFWGLKKQWHANRLTQGQWSEEFRKGEPSLFIGGRRPLTSNQKRSKPFSI